MQVPILMFHSVTRAPITPATRGAHVSKEEFAQYIAYLVRHGYTGISCADLIAIWGGERDAPEKPVVLTFDDGYADLYENVYPALAVLEWRYTIFLVMNRIGKTSDWEGAAGEPLLDWLKIREMDAAGVEFGAHSLTHPSLPKIAAKEAMWEVMGGKYALEDALQNPVHSFAYPYGHYDKAVREMVGEAGYRLAVTTQHGRVRPEDNPLELPRVSVYHIPRMSLKFGPRLMNFRWRLEQRKDIRPIP